MLEDNARCFLRLRSPATTGEMPAFLIYSNFQQTMEVGLKMQLNYRPTLKKDLFFAQ